MKSFLILLIFSTFTWFSNPCSPCQKARKVHAKFQTTLSILKSRASTKEKDNAMKELQDYVLNAHYDFNMTHEKNGKSKCYKIPFKIDELYREVLRASESLHFDSTTNFNVDIFHYLLEERSGSISGSCVECSEANNFTMLEVYYSYREPEELENGKEKGNENGIRAGVHSSYPVPFLFKKWTPELHRISKIKDKAYQNFLANEKNK